MADVDLNGVWELSFGPGPWDGKGPLPAGWRTIPAKVPGNVELDLVAAGVIEEPWVGTRIYALREFETYEWVYRRTFVCPDLAPGQRAELVFDGVDCIADYTINEQFVGWSFNMFVPHRIDQQHCQAKALRPGEENELRVHLRSPIDVARHRPVEPGAFAFATSVESLNVRKAPHMYGWDIMPRLVSAGLWRGVRLELVEPTRFRSVYAATMHADPERRTATLMVDWDFVTDRRQVDGLTVRITLANEDGERHWDQPALATHGRTQLHVDGARLWWPRGYGEAALYDLRVDLCDADGQMLATHTDTVGLRTIRLDRTELTTQAGDGRFQFQVNGVPVFVKGTNWVPLDALHSRDAEHLPAVFDLVVDLNLNMLRCWGGNVYEDHPFFDLCDRHGVMVWQDFAMACAVYPQGDGVGSFLERLRQEAEAIVPRLRNHPSLALWAGNNEGDEAYQWSGLGLDPNTDRPTREVLPQVLRRLDPLRPYLPSSPYRGPAFFAQNRPAAEVLPEQHLWGPRDDFKGPTYTQSSAHFASEIGYHGCNDRESLSRFLEPDHLWPAEGDEQWLCHAVRPLPNVTAYDYRIPLMAKQIQVLFGTVPDTLDAFVLASQISQAEALKFFIEWFRQGKPRRTGILWWNLRDGWPIISDAIVDYFNRPKLAYHVLKRLHADVLPLVAEPAGGRHEVVVVNDTLAATAGRVAVQDVDRGDVLFDSAFTVPVNGRVVAGELPVSAEPAMWQLTWDLDDGRSGLSHYLAGPRPFDLTRFRGWLTQLGLPAPTETARRLSAD